MNHRRYETPEPQSTRNYDPDNTSSQRGSEVPKTECNSNRHERINDKMHAELEKRRNYINRLKNLALFAKNQQDRVIDIQQTTASLAAQDFKIRRLKRDYPQIKNNKNG